jgi:hypothetical protein
MRHARIAAIGIACAVLAVSPANADDTAKGQDGRVLSDARKQESLAHVVCFAGRGGMRLDEVAKSVGLDAKDLPEIVKNVWEGCRQETAKDLSCYPYTINKEDNSRTIYMPDNAPSNALYEPRISA